jgi:peptide-methionine (S)-S-oxide reductase
MTPNPTYQETCTGLTGHTEVVKVIFDPARISLAELLKIFWEAHDPTQGMRQGNDVGTVYRSAVYATSERPACLGSRLARRLSDRAFQGRARPDHHRDRLAPEFYYAEEQHQQYLKKNPNGSCGLRGTGVEYAIPSRHRDDA